MIFYEKECIICNKGIEELELNYTTIRIVDIELCFDIHTTCWSEAGGLSERKFTRINWNEFAGKDYEIPESYCVIYGSNVEKWHKYGKLHRDGDKPAVIYPGRQKQWRKDGLCHRDNDKPAIIKANGERWWYKDGRCHRGNDKPAVTYPNGAKVWYRHGIFIRKEYSR